MKIIPLQILSIKHRDENIEYLCFLKLEKKTANFISGSVKQLFTHSLPKKHSETVCQIAIVKSDEKTYLFCYIMTHSRTDASFTCSNKMCYRDCAVM